MKMWAVLNSWLHFDSDKLFFDINCSVTFAVDFVYPIDSIYTFLWSSACYSN